MFLLRVCAAVAAALILAAPAAADAVVAAGRLLDDAGEPAAGIGVHVYLSRDADADGQVALPEVGAGVTDADGRFTVTTADSPELAAFADENGGYVNLDVVGFGGGRLYYAALVRRYVDGGAWFDGEDTSPSDILLRASDSATLTEPVGSVDPSLGCIVQKTLVATERHRTAIGELHNASDVAYSRLTYGRRADSEINVGFSGNGVTWSVKGSVHVGNYEDAAQTTTITADNWGHRLLTDFSYGKYRYYANCTHQTWWKIQARRWIPGRYTGEDNSQWDHRCLDDYRANYSHFGPADTFSRSTNQYARFVAASTMGFGTGGLELGARSGLSRWVDVFWKFGDAAHHYLCGNDSSIAYSHRIFAGA